MVFTTRAIFKNEASFAQLEAKLRRIKEKSLAQAHNLSIISPSQWLHQHASRSRILKRFPHHCFPHGLDLQTFKPLDKQISRQILNLPSDKKVILFIADSVHNERKGFAYLMAALRLIPHDDLLLAIVGNGQPNQSPLAVQKLHFITDDRLLAAAYSAADLCVVPSLEDNLPNTVLEAMACETPVLGFAVGGIPEMIRPTKPVCWPKLKIFRIWPQKFITWLRMKKCALF
ncbi:MAG: glycosyltransferase [Bacteroidia bacterium]|nr:glycosyltransferase [Bacteroidia bacterium]